VRAHVTAAKAVISGRFNSYDVSSKLRAARRDYSLVAAGRDETQILAEHPTAAFDTRWGHGRVQPEQFVREIYSAIKTGK
jgi:hypothetical protein